MGDKHFSVGEPCFAKVKGYPMWPAEVTAMHGSRFEVFFFGTHEVARIAVKDLLKATPANVDKFSKAKFTTRRFYKEGLQEMKNFTNNSGSKKPSKVSKALKTPEKSSSKKTQPVMISTPTEIPRIRGKDSEDDSPEFVEAHIERNDAMDEGVTSETYENMIQEVISETNKDMMDVLADSSDTVEELRKKVSETKGDTSEESDEGTSDPLDTTTNKSPALNPVVLLDSRDVTSRTESAGGSHSVQRKSPNKRRMEKTTTEVESKEEKVKININLSLEMSPDTFIKIARELPTLLSMSGVNMPDMEVNKD